MFKLFSSKSGKGSPPAIRVHHGYRDEIGGPFVKLERMNRYYPNFEKNYNLVYGVSGTNLPHKVLERARKKKIPVVCHMNSCWHPAYAADYEEKNALLKTLHNDYAQFVVYGSRQAMEGARRYLGPMRDRHQIIYNAVDTEFFRPEGGDHQGAPRILAAGLHQFRHRLEPLIQAMPQVEKSLPGAELIIAGKLVTGEGICDCGPETIQKMIRASGFSRVRFIDSYSQQEAPDVYRQADMLVHLKHMDWTPNVVAEAMACGVPIVHTGNGGVPEIVQDAGVSLGIQEDWNELRIPSSEAVADAIVRIWNERRALGDRARAIAESTFNLNHWIEDHRRIFESLLAG